MKCPSINNLLDYVRGRLAANERDLILGHLSTGCTGCQESQRWSEEVLRLTSEDKLFQVSEETIQVLVARFNSQSTAASPSLTQFFAQLIFDSLVPRQLADVRADPAAGAGFAGRQMLFQAAGYDIDLRVEQVQDSGVGEMIGQILSRKQRPAEGVHLFAQLLRGDVEIDRAEADARGIFKFSRVPSGVYNLKIQVPEGEINIREVASARAASGE
ncbi:MAG: hypothetical protein ACREEM_37445 [Blastocatellia bacterium]